MTIKTWKAEFYPIDASKCSAENALAHSLQKWRGLLPENREKHGLSTGGTFIRELTGRKAYLGYFMGSDTCALCSVFYEKRQTFGCSTCPLAKSRDGVPCDKWSRKHDGEDADSLWYRSLHDPECMVVALENTAVYVERQRKIRAVVDEAFVIASNVGEDPKAGEAYVAAVWEFAFSTYRAIEEANEGLMDFTVEELENVFNEVVEEKSK